ncbi:pyocin knob domain-containing protein [Veillonella sp. VA137]|uniref:pyocin knob domain-containing protein n=1 Tax=Veillonella sp. VA137 TaxID=741828 RepID=UPI000F8F5B7B|nr:pyocin knob domain-containing protein [Veillonella sp. VA137]
MAWSQAYLTDVGKQLQASVMANELKLHIEEIWLGDGNVTNVETANNLGSKKLKLQIAGITQDNTECLVRFRISNESIQTPIVMREIGFYARDKRGQLILYSIMKDEDPSTLPVMNGQAIYRQNMNVAFGFSNAQQVTCNVTLHEGLNEQQVDAKITAHNANDTAHNLDRYAGGSTIPSNIRNWNDLTKPGIYECNAGVLGWANAPSSSKIYPYGQIHVTKTDGNVITQTFYSHGQGKAIKQASRTFYVAWGAWQYFGDWDNTITGIAKHNEGINVTKGDATELVKLITNNKSDSNTLLAPTLAVVKALIGDVNIDVTSILKSQGVRYDFSNENAWYICLGSSFGGLIIQGGKFIPETANITYSIRFTKVLAVLPMMLDEPTAWHEMMVRPKSITTSNFKIVSGSNNTNYPKSRNNGCWIAIGI